MLEKFQKPTDGDVGALVHPAGVRVKDKAAFKHWLNNGAGRAY